MWNVVREIPFTQTDVGGKPSHFTCLKFLKNWRLGLGNKMFPCFHSPSKTLRKGTSGGTLGLPWSLWQDNMGLFCLQSLHGCRVVIYPLKYVKLYLGTEEWACWKALRIGVVFYISKWLVDVVPMDASRIFVFSERKAISGDTLCALHSAAKSSVAVMLPGTVANWSFGPGCHGDLAGSSEPFQLSPLSHISGSHPTALCPLPRVKAPVPSRCQEYGAVTCLRAKLMQIPPQIVVMSP